MSCLNEISVGARMSPLSQAQVSEVQHEIRLYHPDVSFRPILIGTLGDRDRTASLRSMEKSNFFTKEIEESQLDGLFRISIHSAKDLPENLSLGLEVIALTRGKSPADSLLTSTGASLEQLPPGSRVATSSIRREEMIKKIRSDLTFVDTRGNIEERVANLFAGKYDALVVAEAALIRLSLDYLPRQILPFAAAPLQGRLAIVARSDDGEMKELFHCIHAEEDSLSRT